MTERKQWRTVRAAWIATALALVGCGQDAPPYDDLPLRDALRASPEVVASLSFDTRRELAQRLDAAALEQHGIAQLGVPEAVSIDSLARVADEAREDLGDDALVVGEVVTQVEDFELRVDDINEEALELVTVGPIVLHGRRATETQALEDVALRGRAGKWLRELSGRTNTQRMLRTTGLPLGAWAYEDTLYVNGSWLVAMSALEDDGAAPPVAVQWPSNTPLSVDYNPYNLPGTIGECAQQVTETCKCGTSCNHQVTDPTFTSAVDECAWVNQDTSHSAALCILALMSIDDVAACMESARAQCTALPVTTREDAVVFAQNTNCMTLLDICLRDGYITKQQQPSSSGSSSCDGCSTCFSLCESCSNANDSCSRCNDNCSKCNDNCSQCNKNCDDTNQNCQDTNNNAKSCGKCSVRSEPGQSPFPAPVGSTFWLMAPIAYLLARSRRRS